MKQFSYCTRCPAWKWVLVDKGRRRYANALQTLCFVIVLNSNFPSATVLSFPSWTVSPFTLGFPSFIFLSHAFLQHNVFHSCPSGAGGARLIPWWRGWKRRDGRQRRSKSRGVELHHRCSEIPSHQLLRTLYPCMRRRGKEGLLGVPSHSLFQPLLWSQVTVLNPFCNPKKQTSPGPASKISCPDRKNHIFRKISSHWTNSKQWCPPRVNTRTNFIVSNFGHTNICGWRSNYTPA